MVTEAQALEIDWRAYQALLALLKREPACRGTVHTVYEGVSRAALEVSGRRVYVAHVRKGKVSEHWL